jgi:hypothetical protein
MPPAAWCAPLRAREGAGDGAEPHDGGGASKARLVRSSRLSGPPPRPLPAERGSSRGGESWKQTRTVLNEAGFADRCQGEVGRAAAGRPLDLTRQHLRESDTQVVDCAIPGHVDDSRDREGLSRTEASLFGAYPIRGRWFREARYGALRNGAWMVRNSRHGQANNPLALRVVLAEVQRLVDQGEPLSDVVEALCELLVHP